MSELVRDVVRGCERCHLSDAFSGPVPVDGRSGATYLFVGEGVSASEDRERRPFTGAGQVVREVARKVGMHSRECAWTNVVRCHGGVRMKGKGKGKMRGEHVEACRPNMLLEVAMIKPRVIVLCGSVALNWYRPDLQVTKHRGIPFYINDTTIGLGTVHVDYAATDQGKRELWGDVELARKLVVMGPHRVWRWGCVVCGVEGEYADRGGVMYCGEHERLRGKANDGMMVAGGKSGQVALKL